MKEKVVISPELSNSTNMDLMSIIEREPGTGYIFEGRNRLWSDNVEGRRVAVKKFKDSWKNRVIYSLRSSKAKRSYLHACVLKERGFDTPQPVAYGETRGPLHLLYGCWYISEYEQSIPLKEAFKERPEIITDFARFTARLHEAGICHGDLNITNVRIKYDDAGSPQFSLIDLNRMKVNPKIAAMSLHQCLEDVCRFSDTFDQTFLDFIPVYLEERGLSDHYDEAIRVKKHHIARTNFRRRLKAVIKGKKYIPSQ